MKVEFKIGYSWEERTTPHELAERYMPGWPILYQGLLRFLARYEGEFTLHFDQLELLFDLHPDLPIVFENLPHILERLMVDTASAVDLYFGAQGTDLVLLFQRQAGEIEVSFSAGPSVGRRFAALIGQTLTIDARVFFREWVIFLRAILDAMVAVESSIAADVSYQQYLAQLDAIESSNR
jgi:hypothetical protein